MCYEISIGRSEKARVLAYSGRACAPKVGKHYNSNAQEIDLSYFTAIFCEIIVSCTHTGIVCQLLKKLKILI